jgi:hypothetical protein
MIPASSHYTVVPPVLQELWKKLSELIGADDGDDAEEKEENEEDEEGALQIGYEECVVLRDFLAKKLARLESSKER